MDSVLFVFDPSDPATPISEKDAVVWGRWMQQAVLRVALDRVGDTRVSTVFCGVNHAFGEDPPVLWETMVFGGEHDGAQRRYCSYAEAQQGHREMVSMVRRGR